MESRVRSNVVKKACQGALAALTAFLVTACSSSPQQPTETFDGGIASMLPSDLSTFLAHAPAGATKAYQESAWGENVVIVAGDIYSAASGAVCRKLLVERDSALEPGLSCSKDGESWFKARALAGDTE